MDQREMPTKEVAISIYTFFAICIHLALKYGFHENDAAFYPLISIFVLGGIPLVFDLLRSALVGKFGSDLLAGISIAASFILGEYLAGSIVVLMLSGGTALEQYATQRAAAVLRALAKRMPRIAHMKEGDAVKDIDIDQIKVGDQIIVLPHEVCPVDGIVIEGRGSMDESFLTGEPFQVEKVRGSGVFSGTINNESVLKVEVERLPIDSRYAKIMKVMEEAELQRPQFRRIGDRLGAWYTVVALIVAVLGWIIGQDPTRFLAVLVIATPCPLLIAIPVAIIGAVSQAARNGIIVKNPAMFENIDSCQTFIFDKTGTLTYGKPALTEIVVSPGFVREEVLQIAASLEQFSKHPLSQSILKAAMLEKLPLLSVTKVSEKPGEGLKGEVNGSQVEIIGRKQIKLRDKEMTAQLPLSAAGMECIVTLGDKYAAVFRFHDEPRAESRAFISHLGPKHNAVKIMLLSGDRKDEATYLAQKVGITEVLFEKSPEEKLSIVREETTRGRTLFVGDGINDAPAMQAATVGIAFGQNSDVTTEAADAVVLDASLGKVDEVIRIGRRMRTIALQSAIGGMSCSFIGMMLACFGLLSPVTGAIAQEAIDVAAVLNALRVVLPTNPLKEI